MTKAHDKRANSGGLILIQANPQLRYQKFTNGNAYQSSPTKSQSDPSRPIFGPTNPQILKCQGKWEALRLLIGWNRIFANYATLRCQILRINNRRATARRATQNWAHARIQKESSNATLQKLRNFSSTTTATTIRHILLFVCQGRSHDLFSENVCFPQKWSAGWPRTLPRPRSTSYWSKARTLNFSFRRSDIISSTWNHSLLLAPVWRCALYFLRARVSPVFCFFQQGVRRFASPYELTKYLTLLLPPL